MKTRSSPNLLVVLTALPMLAWPRSGRAQFNFITNPDNTITITRYTVEVYPAGGIQLTIPSSINGYPVTTIGTNAFANKAFLTSVTIPDSVTCIDNHAFDGLYHLRSVTIGNRVTTIGDGAFESCSVRSVRIPNSVTSIGNGPFANCPSLTNIDVEAFNPSYTSAGGVLFNKTLTTLVEYPGGLAGSYAIPDSVTSIGNHAFDGCYGLTSVAIGSSVTNIGDAAFAACGGLTNIDVDTANPSYASAGGVLFNENLTTLIEYPGGLAASYAIPDSVSSIGDYAFDSCYSLTNVTIPNTVTSIGNESFHRCSNLASVTIPDSVTSIGDYTFKYCSGLTSVAIPDSVTNIGGGAFGGCYRLTSVTIGNSVTSIGQDALEDCTSLHQAYFQGNAPSVDGGPGSSDTTVFQWESGTVYYVPGTTGWGDTFGGWPTTGWYQSRPQILGTAYGLGVGSQGFQFTISWATNAAVVVEASTNLQNWTPVSTNTLVNGTNLFWDSDWTHYPQRFYRVGAEQ